MTFFFSLFCERYCLSSISTIRADSFRGLELYLTAESGYSSYSCTVLMLSSEFVGIVFPNADKSWRAFFSANLNSEFSREN